MEVFRRTARRALLETRNRHRRNFLDRRGRRLAAQNMTVILIGRSDDRLAMARRRIEAAAPQGL
jgi:hypothetical protein